MAKKTKDPKSKVKADNGGGEGGTDVFKTLFGDIQQQEGASFGTIFSNDNPFRRKPIDPSKSLAPVNQKVEQLGSESVADVGNPIDGDSEKEKKRKRKKEGKQSGSVPGSIDEAPDTPLEKKKSKKDERNSPNLGVVTKLEDGRKGKGKKPNSEMQLKESLEEDGVKDSVLGIDGKENKKKKRKRDELEAKYEERRYGPVPVAKDEGGDGELGGGGKIVGEKRKKMDSPEDMLVTKEGFDDEDKLLRTVFVGNLQVKVKKKVLLKEFSQFGEIESVRIRSIPLLDSKTPRKGAIMQKKINDSVDSVHAYIVFKSEQSAQASLALNMAVVGGNHIRVDRACPPRKKSKGDDSPLYDNKRTVFVGNLPFDVKDEELYQLFCGIRNLKSGVEAIRVIRDPNTSLGKGFAYVLFKMGGDANLVVNQCRLKLRDRDLRLYNAKLTPAKRKNEASDEKNHSSAKKFAPNSRTPDSHKRGGGKPVVAAASYQGLRASKSGVQKKVSRTSEPLKPRSRNPFEGTKVRKEKRPAVAARRGGNAGKPGGGGGASTQAGKKRKFESRTPESAKRNTKARKFR